MKPGVQGLKLVCFAVPEEARPFLKTAANRPDIEVLVTGMGGRNAGTAVSARLDRSKPELVLTCGFAGGLRSGLATGTVLYDCEDDGLRAALASAGAQPGRFHFSDRVAVTASEKRELRKMTGADAVEMESQAIRAMCRECGAPSATVRVILDPVEDNLPLDFNAVLTADKRIDSRRLALEIAKSPARIGALLRLRKQTREAALRLAEVLNDFFSTWPE